jgi:DNA-binding NarL/FixJ family response regulator
MTLRCTSRQRQTLVLLLQGVPYKALAAHLGVSIHTARHYVRQVFKLYGVHSRSELIARFARGEAELDAEGTSPWSERALLDSMPPATRGMTRPTLSPRQHQTLQLLLRGTADKGIALNLGLSFHTARQYVRAVLKSHAVRSRAELLARFARGEFAAKAD